MAEGNDTTGQGVLQEGSRIGAGAIRYLGHSCFGIISEEGDRLLIDPHITGNPASPVTLEGEKNG